MTVVIDAARIYKEMIANIEQLEHSVLQIMHHPDVTQEQVLRIKVAYTEMWASHKAIKTELCKKYPSGRTLQILPWNKQ